MPVETARNSPIKILLHEDGRFRDLSLEGSYLVDRVLNGKVSWSVPVVIYGSNLDDDLQLLKRRGVKGADYVEVDEFSRFMRKMKWAERFGELSLHFDLRNYRNVRANGRAVQRIEEAVPPKDIEKIISFVRDGPRGERRGSPSASMVSDLIVELDRLCRQRPMIISWPQRGDFFSSFVVAVWARDTRPFPLVIAAPKSLNSDNDGWDNVPSSALNFEDLSAEIKAEFGVAQDEVEKAYWVWQLSRGEKVEKNRATTPKNISLENARQFLSVLTKSRPDELRTRRVSQQPAPAVFDYNDEVLDLRKSHPTDPPEIVKAGANALKRQIERLVADSSLDNVIPSAKGVFLVVGKSLDRIISDVSDDGDVITIGIELEAFQHHVEISRSNLGESVLGEILGMFATAALFLRRHPLWAEYQSTPTAPGNGLVGLHLSRALLEDAVRSEILSQEAAQRVNVVLSRAPADNSPIELREGVVRSGENLVAITVGAVGEFAAKEARVFASAAKKKAYERGASAIVSFAIRHTDEIISLAQSRNWRWAHWISDLLKGFGGS
ncbi:hypothetical protein [Phenylobacterium sp.]|uniref:hypothetical protein n=1 Tax=Phenylobacterium sp. TaxID=1871053 RepID=UPI00273097E7|nr:hypothetical protein [Phenylobacterium sp.]MDP2214510.1 hypothetical protein [Phenylobacterium sp.]